MTKGAGHWKGVRELEHEVGKVGDAFSSFLLKYHIDD